MNGPTSGTFQITSRATMPGRRGNTSSSTSASANPPKWFDTVSSGVELGKFGGTYTSTLRYTDRARNDTNRAMKRSLRVRLGAAPFTTS